MNNEVINKEVAEILGMSEFEIKPKNSENILDIEELYIGDRNQTILSDRIVEFSNLKVLIIRATLFKTLSDNIGKLDNLKRLTFYGGIHETIPDSICDLQNLRMLDISKTKVRSYPVCIGKLKNLEMLRLVLNHKVASIPDSICELKNLKNFTISLAANDTDLSATENIRKWLDELRDNGCDVEIF